MENAGTKRKHETEKSAKEIKFVWRVDKANTFCMDNIVPTQRQN